MASSLLVGLLLLICASPLEACELAEPPFKVRAIRRSDNKWTGDAFLKKWASGANLTLSWTESVRVLHANHANVTLRTATSVSFTLHEAGPDDGEGRVMVHVQGSHSARTRHCISALFSLWRVHCVWCR